MRLLFTQQIDKQSRDPYAGISIKKDSCMFQWDYHTKTVKYHEQSKLPIIYTHQMLKSSKFIINIFSLLQYHTYQSEVTKLTLKTLLLNLLHISSFHKSSENYFLPNNTQYLLYHKKTNWKHPVVLWKPFHKVVSNPTHIRKLRILIHNTLSKMGMCPNHCII